MPTITRLTLASVLVTACLCVSSLASAQTDQIRLTFETTAGPDHVLGTSDDVATGPGAPMDPAVAWTLWSDIGLTLFDGPSPIASATVFYGSFWTGVPNNHFLSTGQLFASLSIPVTGISIESYSHWTAVLTAYDAEGNVLATNSLVNATPGFLLGTLSVTTTAPIAWFSVTVPGNPYAILNLDNLTLSTPLRYTEVVIDIKPGESPNAINLASAGSIPVAILSGSSFNALEVDPASVRLAGASVSIVGRTERSLCHAEDVNGDGLPDLLCHVSTAEVLIEPGTTVATLEAKTFDGRSLRGQDSITIIVR